MMKSAGWQVGTYIYPNPKTYGPAGCISHCSLRLLVRKIAIRDSFISHVFQVGMRFLTA